MRSSELIAWLHQQYPATVGNLEIPKKISQLESDALRHAANLLQKEINTCHGPHDPETPCNHCVILQNRIVDILAEADRVEKGQP